MARAADSTPCNVGSAIVLVVGSTSTATRAAAGSNSRNRASRFATNSVPKIFTPVRLPSGRARLATRPSLTGSSAATKRIGIVAGRLLTYGYDYCDPSASQIDSKSRQSIHFIIGGTVQDRHVVALDKACVLQALLESAQMLLDLQYRSEEPYHRHRLLRAHHERPCHG